MKRRKKTDLAGRQKEIFRFIEINPGSHLREIQRRLSVSSMGNLEYHIHNLCKLRVIVEKNEGGYKRYYPAKGAVKNKKLLACMRQKMPRRIAACLIEKMLRNKCIEIDEDGDPGGVTEKDEKRDIGEEQRNMGEEQRGNGKADNEHHTGHPWMEGQTAEDCGLTPSELMENLGTPPSSLSYHLSKMDKKGIIRKERVGKNVYYTVNNPEELFRVIVSYRESFADGIVDSFLESWGL